MDVDDLLAPSEPDDHDALRAHADAAWYAAERGLTRISVRLDTWVKAIKMEGAVLDPPLEAWETEAEAAATILAEAARAYPDAGVDAEALTRIAGRDDRTPAGLLSVINALRDHAARARASVREPS